MKKIYYYMSVCAFVIALSSCEDDKLGQSRIVDSTEELNDFDKWIIANYTNPYNMEVHYKWNDIDSDFDFDYVPAKIEKSIIVARILKHMWVDVLTESAGVDFTRSNIMRIIGLVGTAKYTTGSTGTVTNAYTSSGIKITINRVNETPDNPTIEWLSDHWLKTIYHEFSHGLHQKKPYPTTFAQISNTNYVGDDWNLTANTLKKANKLGFVSRYARENQNEDFVETLSIYLTRYKTSGDDQTWAEILEAAKRTDADATDPDLQEIPSNIDGAEIILKKLAIVKDYLKNTWNIELDDLRETYERHADALDQYDWSKLN